MIYTIGHSNVEITKFIGLLNAHEINVLVDVRSHPYSRFLPHFSKDMLKKSLNSNQIKYLFLGKELGARSENPNCYINGKVQYNLLAQEPLFLEGINRLMSGMQKFRIAMMCAEKDPIECHRALLVSRQLHNSGIPVNHILSDGSLESHESLERRLIKICLGEFFVNSDEYIPQAYEMQSEKVAYQDKEFEMAEKIIAI